MLKQKQSRRTLLMGAMLLGLAGLATGPERALADETRGCDAEVRVLPQNASQTYRTFRFNARATVSSLLKVNHARWLSRQGIKDCVQAHWDGRATPGLPSACENHPDFEFVDYPFYDIEAEVTDALCAANPGVSSLFVTVEVDITGREKCRIGHGHDPVIIAENQQIICEETTAEEPESPTETGEEEAAGDQPFIGDGGGDERADPSPSDDPPASASYTLLPMIRLPGNDLRLIELSAPNWLLCRLACTDDATCGAYTYRAPNAGSGPLCLLKRRAGVPIPDPCCQSGIKR